MRAVRRVVVRVLLGQVAWTVPVGVVLGFLRGWGYALVFFGVALVALVVLLSFMLVWQRDDARREDLLTRGRRAPALLVDSRATNTRIRNRTMLLHTFEAREGSLVIRAGAKAFTHLPIGTEATIAYDTTDPERAIVVEDFDETDAPGQREIDRRFRNRS
jgi:hypothetical protein